MIRIGRTSLNPSLSKFKTRKSCSGAQIEVLGGNGRPFVALEVLYDGINEHRHSKGVLECVLRLVRDSDWQNLSQSVVIQV